MQNIKIDAIGTISEGVYGTVKIDGIGTCEGNLKAERLDVDGKFKCYGELIAGSLDCDGIATFAGNLKVGRMDVDGMLTVTEGNQIDAEHIECDGVISIHGQISADTLVADGKIDAEEIVGDSITIDSNATLLGILFLKKLSSIGLIEATHIRLSGVHAQTVNGQDVHIGPNCSIENLDCSGSLYIHPSSEVRNLTGSYTRHD